MVVIEVLLLTSLCNLEVLIDNEIFFDGKFEWR
jgi:hypothetical protein